MSRFLLFFSVLLLVAGLAAYFTEVLTAKAVLIPKFWVLFGFLAALTIITFWTSFMGIKKGGDISVYSILGAITIKLLLSMVLVLVYLLKIRVNGVYFIIEFFSVYFLFTAFEVYSLLRNLRHQNKT